MKVYGRLVFLLNLILLTMFVFSATSWATTHYVSPTGTATWANSTNISTPCSVATANGNAAAGDLIYLRGGIYKFSTQYTEALKPANSGTSGAWITYKNYPNETPEFVGTYRTRMWGLMIEGNSYIQIDGLIFSDFSDHLIRNGASHIEVKNSTFRNVTAPHRGGSFQIVEACAGGSDFRCYVSNIWVHNNTFYKLAAGGGCGGGISEGGDAVRVGYPNPTCTSPGVGCTTGANHNITIEDNYMAYAGHAVMDTYGTKEVIKNNVAHNEPWYPADNGSCNVSWPATGYTNSSYNGLYSHRIWQISDDFGRDGLYNLIENNRLGYAGPNPNNDGADSLALASSRNIMRYNSLYGSMNNGLMPKYYSTGNGSIGGYNNRIYNNTIYHNGYGYPYYDTCHLSTCPEPQTGIHYYGYLQTGNTIKNNIVYDNAQAVLYRGVDIELVSGNTVVNNWLTPNGDPKFINPDLTQTTSLTLPDLNLQAGSRAIDAGTYLTTAKGSGTNSTTLIVADALYFQDGTWGAEMTHGVTLFPDWIAIGTVIDVVQISSINYTTNTITLASPMSWNDGAPIWLYKKSDGRTMLYGSAPDMGAYEYPEGNPIEPSPPPSPQPLAPGNLRATASSPSQINLSWTDNSNNETGFKIERCTNAGCTDSSLIATLAANIKTYSDSRLTANTTYYYRVRAYNSAGNSGYSNTASARTLLAASLPAAPSNLTAMASASRQLNLSWTDNSNNETGFKIERCTGKSCSSFTQIASVAANARTYVNTGLNINTTYTYRVCSYNSAGNSGCSKIASGRTLGY